MNNDEQKRIWREEKEQMRRDNEPRIQHRYVPIKFGGIKKADTSQKTNETQKKGWAPDEILRKALGLW